MKPSFILLVDITITLIFLFVLLPRHLTWFSSPSPSFTSYIHTIDTNIQNSPHISLNPAFPLIVHQTYISEAELPPHWQNQRELWKSTNPKITYMFHSDVDNRSLVSEHFPNLLQLYDNYKNNVQRADLARYVILYVYGGLYVDFDIRPRRDLTPLLLSIFNMKSQVSERASLDEDKKYIRATTNPFAPSSLQVNALVTETPNGGVTIMSGVTNAILASTKNSEFFGFVLEQLPLNQHPLFLGFYDSDHFRVVASTGPLFLTRVMNLYNEERYRLGGGGAASGWDAYNWEDNFVTLENNNDNDNDIKKKKKKMPTKVGILEHQLWGKCIVCYCESEEKQCPVVADSFFEHVEGKSWHTWESAVAIFFYCHCWAFFLLGLVVFRHRVCGLGLGWGWGSGLGSGSGARVSHVTTMMYIQLLLVLLADTRRAFVAGVVLSGGVYWGFAVVSRRKEETSSKHSTPSRRVPSHEPSHSAPQTQAPLSPSSTGLRVRKNTMDFNEESEVEIKALLARE